MKEAGVGGEEKGHCISQPQLCSFCKNIKALLHCASQHGSPASVLMAVLAEHNTTHLLWQGQTGSKRILAFYQMIGNAVEC